MSVNVRDHGAAADGATLDSPSIQRAIDRCSAEGGGTVIVPAGRYKCGTLRLAPNLNLHLENGAVLLAAEDPALFPVIAKTLNRPGQIQALLWAEGAANVSLTGAGVLDGGQQRPVSWAQAGAMTVICRRR